MKSEVVLLHGNHFVLSIETSDVNFIPGNLPIQMISKSKLVLYWQLDLSLIDIFSIKLGITKTGAVPFKIVVFLKIMNYLNY